MNNVELFEYSLKNREPYFDPFYKRGRLVITQNSEENNALMKANKKLIELITAYKVMNNQFTNEQRITIISEIDKIIIYNNNMNLTAFLQYFMVWDFSFSIYRNLERQTRQNILEGILNSYIDERHNIYLSHGYSDIVLQIMSDNYSHKGQGNAGIKKITKQLEDHEINRYSGEENIFESTFYLSADRSDKKHFTKISAQRQIKLDWAKIKQNKQPDIYLQYNGKIFIIEHKHKKEGGGGQSGQNTEIVDFIRQSEKGISFISYLDGIFFNKIDDSNDSSENKVCTLKNDIRRILETNPENYFVNTAGFNRLLDTITSKT